MNKKGIFMPLLVVFTLILFSWTYYYIVFASGQTHYRQQIGRNQIDLYESYIDAEKALLYIDEAGKMAARDSMIKLAENGGYNDASECGSVVGYNLWYLDGIDCYPGKVDERYEKMFKGNMKAYLDNYDIFLLNGDCARSLKDCEKGLIDVFDVTLDEGEEITIKGNAREDYIFGSIINNEEFRIKYMVDPSYSIIIENSLLDYNELRLIMTDAIKLCRTAECFNRVIDKKQYEWGIVDRDRYVLFEVNTGKKISNLPIVVKFAVGKEV